MRLTIEDIVKATGGQLVYNGEVLMADAEDFTKQVEGVVLDSRLVKEGYVFIATVGERVDGHTFINQVFEKGAMLVVCQQVPEDAKGLCVKVEDSFKALTQIAACYRSHLDIKIVGITGSVGKTSTKEFVATTLAEKYSVLKTEGNFNNEIGVPLTLLKIRDEHEIAVVEMGINHFGEMTRLTTLVKPDVAVITNIGTCHLEFLGDRDGVLKAKTEILTGLKEGGNLVINGDDDKLATVMSNGNFKLVSVGIDEDTDYKAISIVNNGLLGSRATIVGGGMECEVNVPLPGAHMVYNALTAAAVGRIFGMDAKEIADGIGHVKATGGRSNVIKTDNYVLIDDCYNANPVSMRAALELLASANTRKVAILGDMFELGEDELRLHSETGEYAMKVGTDVLVCIGKLSKAMADSASILASMRQQVFYFETRDEAISEFGNILMKNDSILIKASHGMQFTEIVKMLGES